MDQVTEFFLTRMGQRFYEGTMPSIMRSLERIATELEKRPVMAEHLQTHEMKNLLNRAAAALETPGDLSGNDKKNLIEDLAVAAKEIP